MSLAINAQNTSSKAVMLILGSANLQTLKHRVNVAFRLYNSNISFDKIIVSGGCGAHRSSICEASRMDSLLRLKGIPANRIFKEEKSKSTKQNYCYSKKLTSKGRVLIRQENPLYVVSDHWHAIAVASCFRKAAHISDATFHIEGTINPRGPADYTHIFQDCKEDNYCKSILWAFVDAAYFDHSNNKMYYFVDNVYYRKTPGKPVDSGYPKRINEYPGWPQDWDEQVDAAYFNPKNNKIYLFKKTEFMSLTPGETKNPDHPKKIARYFSNWPDSWGTGYLDAAYYDEKQQRLCLFKKSEYVFYNGEKRAAGLPLKIKKDYAADWPFQWGSGDIDAAYYMSTASVVSLFRGTDYLQYSMKKNRIDPKYPKPISLPWPESIWGPRPKIN